MKASKDLYLACVHALPVYVRYNRCYGTWYMYTRVKLQTQEFIGILSYPIDHYKISRAQSVLVPPITRHKCALVVLDDGKSKVSS